jgi:hypothetical protein
MPIACCLLLPLPSQNRADTREQTDSSGSWIAAEAIELIRTHRFEVKLAKVTSKLVQDEQGRLIRRSTRISGRKAQGGHRSALDTKLALANNKIEKKIGKGVGPGRNRTEDGRVVSLLFAVS